jgi:tetratricopeptide (TPR) repeat protein
MAETKAPEAHSLHLNIAEAGKVHALAGRHAEALRHYREAIRLAVAAKAPEIFFRHYSQCVLESLERSGGDADIIAFCEAAEAHYAKQDADTPLHRKDRGSILERLGLAELRSGDVAAARATLNSAINLAGKGVLPLAEQVHGWLARGLAVSPALLTQAQQRHHYFVVRPGAVDAARACHLPAAIGQSPAQSLGAR